jgi:hypothetical protein
MQLIGDTSGVSLEERTFYFDPQGTRVYRDDYDPEKHEKHTFWLRPLTGAENGALMDRAIGRVQRRGSRGTASVSKFNRGRVVLSVVKAAGDLTDPSGAEITKLDAATCGLLLAWMEAQLVEWVSEINDLGERDGGN